MALGLWWIIGLSLAPLQRVVQATQARGADSMEALPDAGLVGFGANWVWYDSQALTSVLATRILAGAVEKLYAIDRWTDHHGLDEYLLASDRLRAFGARTTVLRMTFAEACPLFGPASMDFIYVDGYAHTGQEGGQTLRDWWPKIKPGGVLAGHDYSPQYPLTIDAVDAFVAEHGLTLNLTTHDALPSWWVVKPIL